MNKKFDAFLYKKNDSKAKAFIKGLLFGTPFLAIESPVKTGVDLWIYEKDNHIAFIECEIKSSWESIAVQGNYDFPFEEINFPERKLKFTGLGRPTLFVMINNDLTNYLVVEEHIIVQAPIIELNTRYSTNEKFIRVKRENALIGGDLSLLLLPSPWRLEKPFYH